jgi:phosphatidylglycerol---prolipoprotein diacylglyceryl transferase
MYPRLTDIFRDLFGVNPPFELYTFGLMVATSILLATYLTKLNLDRMYRQGIVGPVYIKEPSEKGKGRMIKSSPSVLVWTMMVIAAVSGVLGAKVFYIIDNFGDFLRRPADFLLTADGLAFWGGLVFGTIALCWYSWKKGLPPRAFLESVAPGLLLAYGVGRIGCYLAGDGDWGVCSNLADKPAWIPGFLWSETFPRSIVTNDVFQFNADRGYPCAPGADGVYPTMLYELVMAAALAGVLWALRNHPFQMGWLFAMYLVLAAIQRFTIELIRVNPVVLEVGGLGFSQAMVVSVFLFTAGIAGLVWLSRRRAPAERVAAETTA